MLKRTKVKNESGKLILKFPIDQYEGIINSYAEKTGWTYMIKTKKRLGIVRRKKNPLNQEQHVAKILQDRLIGLYNK